jgi:hypothetical protein
MGGRQDGGVDNPVLLGPFKLLPIQNQNLGHPVVDEFQFRNLPAFADLGDVTTVPCPRASSRVR